MKKLLLSTLILSSISLFAQWQTTSIYSTGYDLSNAYGKVFASGVYSNDLNVTTDEGITWNSSNTGVPAAGINFGTFNGSQLYACKSNSVFVSSTGNNWSAMTCTLNSGYNVKSMAMNGSTVIAAVNYISLPLSCQTYYYNGSSWVPYGTSYSNKQFTCIRNLNGTIFAGSAGNLVLKSTDGGMTFSTSATGMPNANSFDKYIFCLGATSSAIFAGTQNGNIVRSTNNGTSWTTVKSYSTGSSSFDISDIYVSSTNKIMVACDSGFVYSSDNGTTWAKDNNGFAYSGSALYDQPSKITTSTNYIFVATKNGKVYRRLISEIFSGIKENTLVQVASKVYPNPATANVTIEADDLMFESACSVILTDVVGREVASAEMMAGKAKVNIAAFETGLYTYTIYSNKQSVAKGKLLVN